MTQALRDNFTEVLRLEVLRELVRPCLPEEKAQLHEDELWIRDVLIRTDRPLILARTRIGLNQSRGVLKPITELGSNFLGDWMFKQEALYRISFRVDEAKKEREAVYDLHGAKIWVQEFFL